MSAHRLSPLALPASVDALEWLRERFSTQLTQARDLAERLRTAAAADVVTTLRRWDEITFFVGQVGGLSSLLANVHPDESVRTYCEEAGRDADRLDTSLRQDRALHDVIAALDPEALDEQAWRVLAKALKDFRRAGVDLDDATRSRLGEINERLTALDQDFSRAIRDDVRTVRVAADRLDGLPVDWLEARPAGEAGLVAVTTDYPDLVPVRMFAHDAGVRRDLTVASLERGWPQNDALLRELFELRHELAGLVGYADWPSYDADVKMIGEGPAIPAFIDKIADAAAGPADRDLAVLLERFRADVPDATTIDAADATYYTELVRKEQLQVDAQQVRTYFDFARVRQGLLDVTGRLFGVRYEPVPDAVTWHDDVAAYDVFDAGAGGGDGAGGRDPVGRIYLDLHPRENKYKHAAQFTVVDGIAGEHLPEGALVCNFSRGLMEHSDVVTLFHEFGHLVHHVLGGRTGWARFSGVATEWDFVEAPSQMLEEWAWDADILASFATNAAGEPIPGELVERMRAAHDFGRGLQARVQMFYASMSYWFHADRGADRGDDLGDDQPADLTARMRELQAAYSPYPYIEGTRMFASFGHLGGYSSAYYTYMWSLVIAKDLFSAFDPADLFAPEVAGRYRDRVLAPGGSRDAADLVEHFLGRPYTFEAYAAWLAG